MEAIISFILIAVGVFCIAAPKDAWYLQRGWQFKNAEPSDEAIKFTRISGVIVIIIAICLMWP